MAHLVPDEQAERARQIKLGHSQGSRDGRHSRRDQTLDTRASDEVLHVGRQAERHGLVGLDHRSAIGKGCIGQLGE